ncbi:hypothetical protein CN100_01065 [Sinorhizobium meliloti]|uniref:hypothetical protein n=1 Tax=Rhizobium meliloti TaxID=382 RepID=UPI000FD566C5|nr:hypothetical protein [Sinorhizobium meliloti]RVN63768.1 hypothetical protein CN104_15020 [Sinorhizobium meliloti]RVO27557.1 hypothetical protein CN100_01065 [Sinorhizobium meliloti]
MEERYFPVFPQQPSEEFVSGWHEHLNSTGYPEQFDRVSTVRPFNLADVRLLSGELRVPTTRREDQSLVPCPLCQPNSPKFKVGRMAWFPHEKTVLFIGHECAKKHIGEDYVKADDLYRKQARCRRYQASWEEFQFRRDDLCALVARMMPVAKSLELSRWHQLEKDAPGFAPFLHNELSLMNGSISVMVDTGLKDDRKKRIFETLHVGAVRGYEVLGSSRRPVRDLEKAKQVLDDIAKPLPDWNASDDDTAGMEEILSRGLRAMSMLKSLRETLAFLLAARGFWNAENLAVLEKWGRMDESPFASLEFRREGNRVFLRSESYQGKHYSNITVPDSLFAYLPDPESYAPLRTINEIYPDAKTWRA